MAKVLNPLLSGAASGSISMMTFSGGRFGPVLRSKPNPVRRVRVVQQTNRGILAWLSRMYSSLTQSEVALWEAYANAHPRTDVFGKTFNMSPSQAYMALNHGALRLGGVGANYDSPPLSDPPAQLATLVASDGLVDGTIVLTWTIYGTGDAGDFVEIWVSPVNNSENRTEEIQRFSFSASVAGNLLTKDIEDLVVDGWYWLKARYVDLYGQVTPWLSVQWQAPDVA